MTDAGRKIGNQGFSLLELLVGIAMLAILTLPLLHSMLTSSNTNAKSREIHEETLAAQNVIEAMHTLPIDAIVTDVRAFQTGTASNLGCLKDFAVSAGFYTYDAAQGKYTAVADASSVALEQDTYFIGLEDVTVAQSTYNAMVQLDASAFSQVNQEAISMYSAMDAVFCQPTDAVGGSSGTVLQNPDSLAAADFANTATSLSLQNVDASYFTHRMVRTIEIRMVQNGEDVVAETTYQYTTDYHYTVTETDIEGNSTTVAYDTVLTYSREYTFYTGAAADFSKVYFFYEPNYNTLNGSNYDNITIYNQNGLPIAFFLVKQNKTGYTDGVSGGIDYDSNYQGNLKLKEPDMGQGTQAIATLYSNMGVHLGTGETISNASTFRIYYGIRFYYGTLSGTLVAKNAVNRLYGIHVDIYPDGVAFTGEPLCHFDASKVD